MQMMKVVLVSVLTGVLLSGCQEDGAETEVPTVAPVVKTIALSNLSAQPQWTLTGIISARYTSNLAFRVNGKIIERLVNSGDEVKANQTLFKLDPTDYQLALRVILADIRATESEIQNSQLELERFKRLLERSLISQQNVDQAASHLTVLEERLKSQHLQEKQARNQLEYTFLKSPGLGKILSIEAEQDEVVTAGKLVATLALSGSREVTVQVPENRISQLPKVAKVQIYGSDTAYPVRLRERSGEADTVSRTWTARYEFLSKDESTQKVLEAINLGQTATVVFDSVGSLIRVPNTALYEQGDYASLWKVESGQVFRVPVKVKTLSERWAWVEGDFSKVSTIVSLGVHQLNEGQMVRESAE
ncbi:MAG: efflux RND transporter periplasmic adaptor subunit [Pseudomonadota bacterium]|nr:efflux RND transporter periplasmic adaptor subunit [Pseudomonadota bacterium]